MNDKSLSDIQRVNPYPQNGTSSPRPLKSQAALYEEITMITEGTVTVDEPNAARPRRARVAVLAAAAIAATAMGAMVYTASSPDETLDGSASQPTPAESEPAVDAEALCGVELPDVVTAFTAESPENVTETQTVGPDGRLVYEASFEDTTVTLTWPAIERLSEREPVPSWEQDYGVSHGSEDIAVEPQQDGEEYRPPATFGLHSGMPVEANDARRSSLLGLSSTTSFAGEGECATFSTSATYKGEQGQTFSYDFDSKSSQDRIDNISAQPLVRTTVETTTPPVLDKGPHSCTGALTPLNETNEDRPQEVQIHEALEAPVDSSLEALEDALASTGFRHEDNFTEFQLSDTSLIFAVGANDSVSGEPVTADDYYVAFHVEKSADGWLATHKETASGC